MNAATVVCPDCNGKKTKYVHLNYGGKKPNEWKHVPCWQCNGTGEVEPITWLHVAWGNALRADERSRSRLGTMRDEAKELGVPPVVLSSCHMGRATAEEIATVQAARARAGRMRIPCPNAEPEDGVYVIVARSGDSVWETEPVRYPRGLAEGRLAEHKRLGHTAKIVEAEGTGKAFRSADDDYDSAFCPECGEPRDHYRDGMCELCWHEREAEK